MVGMMTDDDEVVRWSGTSMTWRMGMIAASMRRGGLRASLWLG